MSEALNAAAMQAVEAIEHYLAAETADLKVAITTEQQRLFRQLHSTIGETVQRQVATAVEQVRQEVLDVIPTQISAQLRDQASALQSALNARLQALSHENAIAIAAATGPLTQQLARHELELAQLARLKEEFEQLATTLELRLRMAEMQVSDLQELPVLTKSAAEPEPQE